MRKAASIALVVLLCGLGVWLGEGGIPLFRAWPLAAAVVGGLVVVVVAPGAAWKKAAFGAAFLLLYAVAYFSGLQSFGRAFDECLARGEEVRALLSRYQARSGQYPESLDELGVPVPCGRLTRPTLLVYERTESGYAIRFGDWLVEHSATESEAFMAHK